MRITLRCSCIRALMVGLVLVLAGCSGDEPASISQSSDKQLVAKTYLGSAFEVLTAPNTPFSTKPGPPRARGPRRFQLSDSNSMRMQGMNSPSEERWCDMAGNMYSSEFISKFDYEKPSTDGPIVRVRVDAQSSTFSGRLEARGLKPNFAYQMKLRGSFSDRRSFEAIGYAGRWRLPGLSTNYGDEDYRAYDKKEEVESYLFFDYFMTDGRGNAIRDFALDSSLHVLWSATHQRVPDRYEDLLLKVVRATDPRVYARPKAEATAEQIWAEVELPRYKTANQKKFLPDGEYSAEFALTEESFHSWYRDGGYWATVCKVPVEFSIITKQEK
jgi:hypothetical protein